MSAPRSSATSSELAARDPSSENGIILRHPSRGPIVYRTRHSMTISASNQAAQYYRSMIEAQTQSANFQKMQELARETKERVNEATKAEAPQVRARQSTPEPRKAATPPPSEPASSKAKTSAPSKPAPDIRQGAGGGCRQFPRHGRIRRPRHGAQPRRQTTRRSNTPALCRCSLSFSFSAPTAARGSIR